MTEILNERGRARAGGPERAAQACLQPNAIGENAGESARGPQVLRAHSVRTGERGRARAGGASLLAAERDWRERRRERVRATSSTGALGARRRTSGENAGFDDSARSAEAP
jgi:hypothetical protein